MNRTCRDLWGAIVELAEGQTRPEALAHVEGCANCLPKFEELKRIMVTMAVPHYAAPRDLVLSAKALMQPRYQRMEIRRTSLQLAGARSASADFQAIYGSSDVEIRVMYSKVDQGWEIMGKVPDLEWAVDRNGEPLALDAEGRFHFLTKSLDDSRFTLEGHQQRLLVPDALTED